MSGFTPFVSELQLNVPARVNQQRDCGSQRLQNELDSLSPHVAHAAMLHTLRWPFEREDCNVSWSENSQFVRLLSPIFVPGRSELAFRAVLVNAMHARILQHCFCCFAEHQEAPQAFVSFPSHC